MAKYVFNLPLYVDIPRKTKKDKRVYLNMNTYRNLHHIVNNQAKKIFEPIGDYNVFQAEKVRIEYSVQKNQNRLYDLMNVVSVVDKFFLDWLVNNGFLPNDTVDNVEYSTIKGYRKSHFNCVIAIVEVLE